MSDVVVVGAGLAGLSAAYDLAAGGADVVVLEARDRVGGRVEQVTIDDGRPVQLGGEVVGRAHTAYLGLVEELGLTVQPSYVEAPGHTTYALLEGTERSDEAFPFTGEEERDDYARVERLFGELVATVDPDDPWSHADASRLDSTSIGTWLRSVDALSTTVRALTVGSLGLADGSIECSSLLAELRKAAAVGDRCFYDVERWESHQVTEGSAEVAIRLAERLGERVRLDAEVESIRVSSGGCRIRLADGEKLGAEAVVCALPVGVVRSIQIEGVRPERLESLHRQRNAVTAKIVVTFDRDVWADVDASGLADGEFLLGSTWPQRDRVLSALVPPERIGWLLAVSEQDRAEVVRDELERMYGSAARNTVETFVRLWGVDPYTLGYVTHWWPGDVLRVGPLHGTHDPPFYVAGSDQWVAGYLEGAVQTGRAAAAAALGAR